MSQIDNSQQANSGMSFDQQLTAQTEKLNQQASTIQTSESKSADTDQAPTQDAKLTTKAANDADEKKVDNSEIVEAMAGMAVAPSLLSGINLAAKVIDHLTSTDTAAQVESIKSVPEARVTEKSLNTESLNTAIAKNTIFASTEVDSVINREAITKSNAQDASLSLSELKTIADAKALNSSIQNTLGQTNTTLSPELAGYTSEHWTFLWPANKIMILQINRRGPKLKRAIARTDLLLSENSTKQKATV